MKYFSIFLILVSIVGCKSTRNTIEYTDPGFYLRPVLKMKVVPTFSNPVIYEVNRHKPYHLLTTTYEGAGGYDWKGIKSKKRIELTEEQYSTLVSKLEKALEFPKDKTRGMDGDTWMLESSLYQYTAVAFWEPEHKTDQRGLEGFVKLKNYLTQLSTEN
ncbi:hypothetical protein L1077_20135 [Pseudoalteromonas luteoviolacea]|uniref:hypothetical protein n=1 Tax=Pseudoalteromonas luteoviolacea TaxID=43657 RepID=UPI001F2C4813|nr:hypothetical protein [Pseudoalteromonas luteoviolacea]MCF6441750.1 hypothetical protein [Pseudoalteromonas luteoviolacea]